jgi:hypothetical protein
MAMAVWQWDKRKGKERKGKEKHNDNKPNQRSHARSQKKNRNTNQTIKRKPCLPLSSSMVLIEAELSFLGRPAARRCSVTVV